MATYSIKKVNNGEYKEVEKEFILDTNKFRSKSDTLYFDVLGEENPVVFDLDTFVNIMMSQINQGFMESLEYKDGLLIATTRDGNIIKKYSYDFGWERLKGTSSKQKDVAIERHFVLDANKFRAHPDTLCFRVLGEEEPSVFGLSIFVNSIVGQIEQGLMENLEYKDGLFITTTRDGDILKRNIYDFGFKNLKNTSSEEKQNNSEEYQTIEKRFVLDIDKFRGHGDTLSFDVLGEDNPTVFDLGVFVNSIIGQIDQGLIEDLEFKDGLLVTIINDGKTIKKYTYDLGFNRLEDVSFGMRSNKEFDELKNLIYKIVSLYKENPNNALEELKDLIFKIVSLYKENPNNSLEELKSVVFKIVSCYNENPNREIIASQKFIRMILDIMDGDRCPKIEDKDEILKVFQVYHANKAELLGILLDNVVFYDDNGNVLEYGKHLREQKLRAIKYDVLSQMEIKMLMFAVNNDAYEMYQEYNSSTYIPRVAIQYKYVDEEGNEVEPPVEEVEAGTIFSMGKEIIKKGATDLKDLAFAGGRAAAYKASEIIEKVKEKRRTK